VRRLSRWGPGKVYLARQEPTSQLVALKVLAPAQSCDPKAVHRFGRERSWAIDLNHPHIVRGIDAGEVEGVPYFVMELLDGLDLSRLVERAGPLPVADACELARQAALALHYAHERGIVRRDVKPSNLFLTRAGQVKLLDLGLARDASVDGEEVSLTESGHLLGTIDYMAPEQAFDTHSVDARSDAYSLGCTLYKLLAGHPPFGGPEYRHLLKKALAHAQRPVPPISERRPDVPPEVAAVLRKLLAKEPGERFASLREVAEALGPFAAGADLATLASSYAPPQEFDLAEPPGPTDLVWREGMPDWIPFGQAKELFDGERASTPPPLPSQARSTARAKTSREEQDLAPHRQADDSVHWQSLGLWRFGVVYAAVMLTFLMLGVCGGLLGKLAAENEGKPVPWDGLAAFAFVFAVAAGLAICVLPLAAGHVWKQDSEYLGRWGGREYRVYVPKSFLGWVGY
jgi:serine/threonine protein kinase